MASCAEVGKRLMEVKALIFDCDGTLTDSMESHFLAWHRSLASQGIDLKAEDFYSQSGTPSSRVIPAIARRDGVEIDFLEALEDKERYFLDEIKKLKVIPSVVAIASKYRGRLPMAVASGGTRTLVTHQLEQAQIADWFQAVVTCEDTEKHKPDPDVFLEAAARLGVDPVTCCVFEDGEPGILAAEAAGMKCIDVRPFRDQKNTEAATLAMLELFE
jgi:HAD superfamily hydrolase (TIGR01509 family)